MAKINQEEYQLLKELENRDFKWLAKDRDKTLIASQSRPSKTDEMWRDERTRLCFNYKDSQLFQFIQWSDSEPYSIAELIEEYECSAEHVSHVVNERVKALGKAWSESEETEVKKDIEWLRNEIKKLQVYTNNPMFGKFDQIRLWDVEELINQLDEPEVLSQEWIDDNKVARINNLRKMTTDDVVSVDKLQNLLVPKQELPVIPQFVAEWIEETKPYNSLRVAFEYIAQRKRDNHDDELAFWVEEGNSETFARAWLYGYTIEKEEQKYYVVKSKGLDGVYYYFTKFDDEVHGLFGLPNDKEVAYKFDDKEKAQAIANYTNSEVGEMEE